MGKDLWGLLALRYLLKEFHMGAVTEHGGAYVIAGDWDMTPAELEEVQSWRQKVRGRVVAPALPTCRSSNGGHVIDSFVVDDRLGEECWESAQ